MKRRMALFIAMAMLMVMALGYTASASVLPTRFDPCSKSVDFEVSLFNTRSYARICPGYYTYPHSHSAQSRLISLVTGLYWNGPTRSGEGCQTSYAPWKSTSQYGPFVTRGYFGCPNS